MAENNPLRGIYVVNHAPMYGANQSLLTMLDGLIERGHVLPYVIVGKNGELCNQLHSRGIEFAIIPHEFKAFRTGLTPRRAAEHILRIAKYFITARSALDNARIIARKFQPDFIHTNIGPDFLGYELSKSIGNIPHFWHLREYADLDFGLHYFPSKRSFKKHLSEPNNHPIAITNSIAEYFTESKAIRVIYNGIYPRSQATFNASKDPFFLFVGRIEQNKGIEALVRAFTNFCDITNNINLVIAGTGTPSYTHHIKEICRNHSHRVHFIGFTNSIDSLMQKALALVVPSYAEGFGRITAEAMFNGCLVIGRNTAGTKEILSHDNLGILFDSDDEIESCLHKVANAPFKMFQRIILAAQKSAQAQYSCEANTEAIISFYNEIMKPQ